MCRGARCKAWWGKTKGFGDYGDKGQGRQRETKGVEYEALQGPYCPPSSPDDEDIA